LLRHQNIEIKTTKSARATTDKNAWLFAVYVFFCGYIATHYRDIIIAESINLQNILAQNVALGAHVRFVK
jgi:hypothetical protein